MYSFESQSSFRATRFSPNLPIFLGEDIQILNATSRTNMQMIIIELIILCFIHCKGTPFFTNERQNKLQKVYVA